MLSTRLSTLLGIKYPIILPGMSWISTPELVSAVSNAGGIGILATGPLTPEQTRESIRKIRQLTSRPFGIGATLLMPGAKENAEVALEEKVPVINFSLGKGDWITKAAHEYGGKVIATVVSRKHALSAESIGVDALMVTGHEAAAHGGDVTTLVLIPAIRSVTKLPIIAAGGFATGYQLTAALALGADGVAMGSRFAVSKESPLHQGVKERVTQLGEDDTIYSRNFDGLFARVMKTPAAVKACKRPKTPLLTVYKSLESAKMIGLSPIKILPALITRWDKMYQLAQFGAATEQIQAAINGDLDAGVQFIGQSQGLINDIPSVDDIMQRVIREAKEAHTRNSTVFAEQ